MSFFDPPLIRLLFLPALLRLNNDRGAGSRIAASFAADPARGSSCVVMMAACETTPIHNPPRLSFLTARR